SATNGGSDRRRDRGRHEPLPHGGTSGELGRDVSGQQREGRKEKKRQHSQGNQVPAEAADRVGSSRRSHYRYRAERAPPPHHAPPRLPTGGGGCRTRNPCHLFTPDCSSHYLPGARSCLLRSTPGRALHPPLCST